MILQLQTQHKPSDHPLAGKAGPSALSGHGKGSSINHDLAWSPLLEVGLQQNFSVYTDRLWGKGVRLSREAGSSSEVSGSVWTESITTMQEHKIFFSERSLGNSA